MKVVIPTAGTGSRLGKHTKYTNKSLLRVGEKAVISHIIDYYPKDTQFVIILGYLGHYVRKYIEIAHSDRRVTFVSVDKYEGPGSGLTQSLLAARKFLQCPFVFHACDTLLGEPYEVPKGNYLLLSETKSANYRTIKTSSEIFVNDVDHVFAMSVGNTRRLVCSNEYHYTGVAGIDDYEEFWKYAAKTNGESDIDVFSDWLDDSDAFENWPDVDYDAGIIRVAYCLADFWYDTGCVDGLERARADYPTSYDVLHKVDEDIYVVNGKVIKFFADSLKCTRRVLRANRYLPDSVPELTDSGENFFAYSFIDGLPFSKTINPTNLPTFLSWCQQKLWTSKKFSMPFHPDCYEFYVNKTIRRINTYCETFDDLPSNINGQYTPSALALIETVARYDIMFFGIKSHFHGDLVIDNIIDTGFDYMLIDWRESFSTDNLKYGDVYYDLAKFAHSLVMSHSGLIAGQFTFKEIGITDDGKLKAYSMDLLRSENMIACLDAFWGWCKSNDYSTSKIKALMGIIWINMAPLHPKKMGEFLFNYGRNQLHNALEQIKNEHYTKKRGGFNQ